MKIACYTDSKKNKNEDVYGVTSCGAFVLDGASSLIDTSFSPGGNDVHWMVNWWKKYLEDELDKLDEDIEDILQRGINAFNGEVGRYVNVESLSQLEQVSAGLAIVRSRDEYVECYVLGDVEITVEAWDGGIERITDTSIQSLDDEVIDMIAKGENREERLVFKGFTKEELRILKRNRMKMNAKGGYPILGSCTDAISKGINKVFPSHQLKRVLLSTDGINTLDNNYTRERLLAEINKRGLKDLVSEMRSLEKNDSGQKKIRRLKMHDDVTAVFLDFIHAKSKVR